MFDIKCLPLNTLVTTTRKDDKHFADKVKTNVYEIGWYDYTSWELVYLVTPGYFNDEDNRHIELLSGALLYYDEEKRKWVEESDYDWNPKASQKRVG